MKVAALTFLLVGLSPVVHPLPRLLLISPAPQPDVRPLPPAPVVHPFIPPPPAPVVHPFIQPDEIDIIMNPRPPAPVVHPFFPPPPSPVVRPFDQPSPNQLPPAPVVRPFY